MSTAKIAYTVAGANQNTVSRTVQMGGADIEAQVPALVVELVSSCEAMGHTLTFVGAEASVAQAIFTPGAKVTATFKRDT